MPALMNIREAAEYLGISHHTLYRLVERREVPAAKIGGSWRLNRTALESFVSARSATAAPIILIVERDAQELERLANSLRGRPGTVFTASTWSEAVSRAEEVEPDLIFASVPIPGRPASSAGGGFG